MHFLQAISSDLSVLIVCNKTGGTIKGDIKKFHFFNLLCSFPLSFEVRAIFVLYFSILLVLFFTLMPSELELSGSGISA